jgi:hypothetical protein
VFGFLKWDGTVAGEQFPGFDRAGGQPTALGTRLWLFGGLSLPCGGQFTDLTGELAAGVVSEVLDFGEVEIRRGAIGPEEFVRDCCEELVESEVMRRVDG